MYVILSLKTNTEVNMHTTGILSDHFLLEDFT